MSLEKTFRELTNARAFDDAVQGVAVSDPTPNDSWLLLAAHTAGLAPDLVNAVYAKRIASWQHDGHWSTSDFRPPHSSSLFTATATAVRAIRAYLPDEMAAAREAALLPERAADEGAHHAHPAGLDPQHGREQRAHLVGRLVGGRERERARRAI